MNQNQPLIAYQIISMVDQLNLAVRQRIDPILRNPYCPSVLKERANALLVHVDVLAEQIADRPDVENLRIGLNELRLDVEQFMKDANDYQFK